MFQLEVPLVLARGLELDNPLGIRGIDTIKREGAILGVDQVEPLRRPGRW